ncbi:DUF881 domain-containing protein [Proteocatella sphenisci]|uniref:DUF881 domain-containing protein n=1 Tax=Proteocatella sphenisci TaxID=181070 RepID=UPI00048AC11E|nr:DUF881 domain-containing protein [Proteocatella sphenisci]
MKPILKNKMAKILFFFFSFIIGVTLVMQFKLVETMNNGQSIYDKAAHLQLELTGIKERKEKLEKEIKEVESKISEINNSELESDTLQETLKSEMEKYELQIGYKKAQGEGIELELLLQDIENYDVLINNYDLILSIVNKLNAAGAEGIAINDERIVTATDFRYEEGTLHVNSNPIKSPFVFRAIGNPDTLEASLNIRYGILWELKHNFGINSRIEKKKTVVLPMYVKEIVYKFAEVVED